MTLVNLVLSVCLVAAWGYIAATGSRRFEPFAFAASVVLFVVCLFLVVQS
jgi:hypothetical protein